MDEVDCLERSDHDLKLDDPAVSIPFDHVDTVDDNAVDICLKLQNYIALPNDLTNIFKAVVCENMQRRVEIHLRDRLADLRRMYHRRVENNFVGKQFVETRCITCLDDLVPFFKCVHKITLDSVKFLPGLIR